MDWRARIERAKVRGHFTGKDRIRADSWLTCAVGEHYPGLVEAAQLDDDLSDMTKPFPLPKSVMDLGEEFADLVDSWGPSNLGSVFAAERVLNELEALKALDAEALALVGTVGEKCEVTCEQA